MSATRLFLALVFFLTGTVAVAWAEDLNATEIVNALDPHTAKKGLTRSWQKRSLTVQKGVEEDGPPSVDLYINFAYNSADLQNDSQIILDNLAKALTDQRLLKFKFLVAGHTDAKGSDQYNLDLSEPSSTSCRKIPGYEVWHRYGSNDSKKASASRNYSIHCTPRMASTGAFKL